MKTKIKIEQEVEIALVRIQVAVRYEEEDIPNDFPLRSGDMWKALVEMDTGLIRGWPKGKTGDLYMKVCECGTYTLMDSGGNEIAEIMNDYVPHGVVPGSCGDYIDLKINADGIITNWPKSPDVSRFFEDEE